MAAKLAGAGGGTYNIRQNADINVTPFVDILLVLLIIFMVAVPMATTSIKLDMPPAKFLEVPPKPPVLITIQDGGALYLAGQPTSRPACRPCPRTSAPGSPPTARPARARTSA